MSASNSNIIVWEKPMERTAQAQTATGRGHALRLRDEVEILKTRYSEVASLAAQLIDECRRLRADNEDLRGSAEIWIALYEHQLERANSLEKRTRLRRV
jgi:hypothetical protein